MPILLHLLLSLRCHFEPAVRKKFQYLSLKKISFFYANCTLRNDNSGREIKLHFLAAIKETDLEETNA